MLKSPDGLLVFDELDTIMCAKQKEAANKLYNIIIHRPGNVVVEVQTFRKYVPLLLDYVLDLSKINRAACLENERIHKKTYDRSNKRWSNDEDERLIELICQEESSMTEISAIFGRSPQAIASRITTLVGRKRISQNVAGRFVGYINGEKTEADIAGTLHKEVS